MKNASVSNQTSSHESFADVLGQVREMDSAALRGMENFYFQLRSSDRQRFVGSPSLITDAVAKAVEELLPKRITIPHKEVERWNKYYRDEYGIPHSFEALEIPVQPAFQARLIVMHEGVSNFPQRIVRVYKKHSNDKWWQFAEDLDIAVPEHDRSGTYGLWVADTLEAPDGFDDEKKKNLSTNDVLDRSWITTTLPERLIDGDMYLLERRHHLDQVKVTLCPGSRALGGRVPSVYWRPGSGWVYVDGWNRQSVGGDLRFRRAIC